MSGLGSGMPKSVTLVTQVTVNLLAHVRDVTEGARGGDEEPSTAGDLSPGVAEIIRTVAFGPRNGTGILGI